MVRFGAVLLRVPRYIRLAYHLTRDGRLSPAQRALAATGAAYTISPLDPLPGFIPVIGQLDDLAVLLLTLRTVLRGCPPELAREHLERTGLSLAAIDADLAAVRATALWVAAQAGRALIGAGRGLARLGGRAAAGALGRLRPRTRPDRPAAT
jgi:uncharacterized membrane protein YkvA (DUF1232 family)